MNRWQQEHMLWQMPGCRLPPNSPELNPIENLWAIVQARLIERRFTTVIGLLRALQQIWLATDQCQLRNLNSDMSRRVTLVKRARGGHIRLH